MTVSFMFAIGDVSADLIDPSGQPWVAVVYRITGSQAATIVLILIMVSQHRWDIRFLPCPDQNMTGKETSRLLGKVTVTDPLIGATLFRRLIFSYTSLNEEHS